MTSVSTEKRQRLRDTGLKAVGKIPWGTHFYIFYETKMDLLDVVVPYFETGLKNNESCLWIVAPFEFLTVKKAQEALSKASAELGRLSRNGKIQMEPHRKWFGANGGFDASKAVRRFRMKLGEAQKHGYAGLRVNGASAWVMENLGVQKFRKFQHDLDRLMEYRRIIAACTFPLALSGAEQIFLLSKPRSLRLSREVRR